MILRVNSKGDWMSRYDHLLLIYFSVAHDRMQLNRQGSDRGAQYRSAIVPQSYQQAKIAKAYISQLNQARAYNRGCCHENRA